MFFIRKNTSLLLLLIFITCLTTSTAKAGDNLFGDLYAKLNRTEQEIIKDELRKRLPELVGGEANQKIAKDVLKYYDIFNAKLADNSLSQAAVLAGTFAEITKDSLQEQIEARFEPGSPVRTMLESVQAYPEIYQNAVKTALSPDGDWRGVSRQVLDKIARKRIEEAIAKGHDVWKNMARSIIKPPAALSGVIDPVDIYVQGIGDWIDFVDRSRTRFNNAVLGCLHRRYRQARNQYGPEAARDEIGSLGLKGFKCKEDSSGAFFGNIVRWLQNLSTDTGTLSRFNLNRDQLIDLMEQYEQETGGKGFANFDGWFRDRFNKKPCRTKKTTPR